jgi:integrase
MPKNARDVIIFTMLTGRRIGEVVGLLFDRVDERSKSMVLPEEDDKQGLERLFPLADAALAIIQGRRRLTNGVYVFQGVRQGKAPTQSLAAIPLRKLLGSEKWKHRHFTLHDLRRTYRTLASRLGVRFEVAELLLGHSLPGVHGTYDRHTYQEEMRAAAELIAAHILKLAPKGALA